MREFSLKRNFSDSRVHRVIAWQASGFRSEIAQTSKTHAAEQAGEPRIRAETVEPWFDLKVDE